jgi:large subunit ribosomal protein L13
VSYADRSTYFPSGKNIERQSYVIDASGQRLGRVASEAARLLMGKNRPDFTPFLDTGAHVIIVNAAKVKITGQKRNQKVYYRYTGFPGGLRQQKYSEAAAQKPEQVVRLAIDGMLPKTKLGRKMSRRLRVYAEKHHPHPNLQPENHYCASMDLRDFGEFYRVLDREYAQHVKRMSDEEAARTSVTMGAKQYTPRRIASELRQHSEFGEKFARMMYEFHFSGASSDSSTSRKPAKGLGAARENDSYTSVA